MTKIDINYGVFSSASPTCPAIPARERGARRGAQREHGRMARLPDTARAWGRAAAQHGAASSISGVDSGISQLVNAVLTHAGHSIYFLLVFTFFIFIIIFQQAASFPSVTFYFSQILQSLALHFPRSILIHIYLHVFYMLNIIYSFSPSLTLPVLSPLTYTSPPMSWLKLPSPSFPLMPYISSTDPLRHSKRPSS